MSPSESQLRAALHDGEGDVPDANSAIAAALRVRYERRRRYTAVAGAAAAAAVVGVGVTLLVGLNSGSSEGGGGNSADKAAGAAGAYSAAAGGGRAAASQRSAQASSAAAAPASLSRASAIATDLTCPAAATRYLLPGGGGTGSFGGDGDLFAAPVAAARVCAYPLKASAGLRSVVLVGDEVTSITRTLEAAPVKQSHAVCSEAANFAGGTIEVLPVTTQGARLKSVVITIGCPTSKVTNGTAARYPAAVPTRLRGLLSTASTKSTANGPSGSSPSR